MGLQLRTESRYIPSAMSFRDKLGRVAAVVLAAVGLGIPHLLAGQESPARRVANIVSVAVEEYRKGVDDHGRLISRDEYDEAVGFLKDARATADRLPGDRVAAAKTLLDSIMAAIEAKKPPSALAELNQRFALALGSEAALELPRKPIDLADGTRLYAANCASCHGPRGMGDGRAGAALNPKPTAIGSGKAMHDVAPAMMFRKVSVGVAGTAMPAFAPALTAEQRWNIVMYLSSLRSGPEELAEGEGLFTQNCAQCHGSTGMGDAPLSRSLSKLPGEIGSFAWQVARSDSQLAAVVRAGMPGTPMPPSANLNEAQIQSVVAYLRSLPMRERSVAAAPVAQRDSNRAVAAAAESMTLLDQSLTAARNGRSSEASDPAFDAYLASEPIETPARARNPGVVATMEKHFADFKGAIRGNDLGTAERARDAIEANMQRVVDLTRPPGSGSEAFLQSFLIILREGFEAILVIGAVVAFLLKTGHRERLRSIWFGIALALVSSALTAIVLRTVLQALPATQEIIEGGTLLIAVAVLFSVSYWLISRVEAAKWQAFIRDKVTLALEQGGGRALAFVAFLAVYREGAETALFYQALFNEGPHVALPITLGILVGFAALAVIFTLFYRFGVRIPLRPFFSVTSVLLYYMAFVFMGKGIRELQEGDIISLSAIRGFPHVEWLGLYPSWEGVLAQLALLLLFAFALLKTFWPKRSVTLPTVMPAAVGSSPIATSEELARIRTENDDLRR